MRRLTHNLTSDYCGAAQQLNSKRTRRKIVAYVESYEDVAFWRNILGELENKERYFQIMLPSQRSLAKGKKMALFSALHEVSLGKNMIACVDSDYDYLLQGATSTSQTVNTHSYIFQTYTYAIENYHCYSETLREVCTQATLNDHFFINFPQFLTRYSRIIYPLFIWHLYFYRQRRDKEFPMQEFHTITRLTNVNIHSTESTLNLLEKRTNRKLVELDKIYSAEHSSRTKCEHELQQLGVMPENTYLYIQGHHLMDNVIMRILTPLCGRLRREREEEINQLAISEEQRRTELACYHHGISPIGFALSKNFAFKILPEYQKLRNDLATL